MLSTTLKGKQKGQMSLWGRLDQLKEFGGVNRVTKVWLIVQNTKMNIFLSRKRSWIHFINDNTMQSANKLLKILL